jgi:hypothetical protein
MPSPLMEMPPSPENKALRNRASRGRGSSKTQEGTNFSGEFTFSPSDSSHV